MSPKSNQLWRDSPKQDSELVSTNAGPAILLSTLKSVTQSSSGSQSPVSDHAFHVISSDTPPKRQRRPSNASFVGLADENAFIEKLTDSLPVVTSTIINVMKMKDGQRENRFIIAWKQSSGDVIWYTVNLDMTCPQLVCKGTFEEALHMVYHMGS